MYFCWLIGFFVKLQVLIKCPFRELQAPSLMTIFEIFLVCLNATLYISILNSVPRRFVKKMKCTKNNENVNFFIICLSQILRMGDVMKRVIPRRADPQRITLRVSYNLPVLPWTWRQPQFFDQYREWSRCPGSCLRSMP